MEKDQKIAHAAAQAKARADVEIEQKQKITDLEKKLSDFSKFADTKIAQLNTTNSSQSNTLNSQIKDLQEKLADNEFFVNTLTASNSELNQKLQDSGQQVAVHKQAISKSKKIIDEQKLQKSKMEVEFKTLRDNLENEILVQKTANLSLAEKLEETKMQQEKTKKIQKQSFELINKENASSIQKKVQQITTLSDKLAESMETIESKENELKITKDKLTNLDRIKSHDVEKYKVFSQKSRKKS